MITYQGLGGRGQLGNQMFQYALLLGVAARAGFKVGVPFGRRSSDRFSHFALPDLFALSAADSSGVVQPFRFERGIPFYDFAPGVFGVQDGTDFDGVFESPLYWVHCADRVRREFALSAERMARAGAYLAEVRAACGRGVVFVHVRRGDSLDNSFLLPAGVDFYARAVAQFRDCELVVLSDDVPWCRGCGLFAQARYSPFADKADDLALMLLADGGVVSNSSFSWWGAWLGRPGRRVVALGSVWVGDPRAVSIRHVEGWSAL